MSMYRRPSPARALLISGLLWSTAAGLVSGLQARAFAAPGGTDGDVDPRAAGEKGLALVRSKCIGCHGPKKANGKVNVLDRAGLLRSKVVVEGKPDASKLLSLVKVGEMPSEGDALTDAEVQTLSDWIASGFKYPDKARPAAANPALERAPAEANAGGAERIIPNIEILNAVLQHLRDTPRDDREFQRYLTLTNIHNLGVIQRKSRDPAANPVTADSMRLYRAAVSKALNSLSSKRRIQVPKAVDANETVLAIDLRHYGWDSTLWNQLLGTADDPKALTPRQTLYPYGLNYGRSGDNDVLRCAAEIDSESRGVAFLMIRADWFVANATRPPLYQRMLRLPATVAELEKQLRVNVEKNLSEAPGLEVRRAAFHKSGVSSYNRVVERHETDLGAYWKSYDFGSEVGASNALVNPLGPRFAGNRFPERAFEHAGGEMIFTLPNHLQGYFLCDAKGQRIDVGPPTIVNDPKGKEYVGSQEIFNGFSCMKCHKDGVISTPPDEARSGATLQGEEKKVLDALFPDPTTKVWDELLKEDKERFIKAQQLAVGHFDNPGAVDWQEPISELVKRHNAPMGRDEILSEFCADPDRVLQFVGVVRHLAQLGQPKVQINRQQWESQAEVNSAYQMVAQALQLGTPRNPVKVR